MNGEAVHSEKGTWFERLVLSPIFCSTDDGTVISSPEEMIHESAQRAFKISTALGLLPGPVGMASILPEVAALTKLQINLIYRIARYHRKQEKVNKELILLIFGNAFGIAAGEALAHRLGSRLIIRSMNARITRSIARRIGSEIIERAAEKAMGRWIPVILAPLFGYFSRSMTQKIGREADKLFSGEIELEGLRTPSPSSTSGLT